MVCRFISLGIQTVLELRGNNFFGNYSMNKYALERFKHLVKINLNFWYAFVILVILTTPVMAQNTGIIDPRKNLTPSTTITWRYSDNVSEACNAERQKIGEPAFQSPSRVCSFWTKSTCLIITNRDTFPESLAHEVLHCFQGKWH